MKLFGINAVGIDGTVFALTFECNDIIDCEYMIKSLGLQVDEYGYGELVRVDEELLNCPEPKHGGH